MSFPQAKKKWGQHFLRDPQVIQTICNSMDQKPLQRLIEVGPGPGVLTAVLAQKPWPFFVIEKDRDFEKNLSPLLSPQQIFWQDALLLDWKEVLHQHHNVGLISNLPYNVSVPLLILFLQHPQLAYLTLMFQKEVADRILPASGQKNTAGSLFALVQSFFHVTLLCQVKPGAFTPAPEVDSKVLFFERKQDPVIALSQFSDWEQFLRRLFQHRRKTLSNSLKAYYSMDQLTQVLSELNISLQVRAESLDLPELQGLYYNLNK